MKSVGHWFDSRLYLRYLNLRSGQSTMLWIVHDIASVLEVTRKIPMIVWRLESSNNTSKIQSRFHWNSTYLSQIARQLFYHYTNGFGTPRQRPTSISFLILFFNFIFDFIFEIHFLFSIFIVNFNFIFQFSFSKFIFKVHFQFHFKNDFQKYS